MVFHFFLPALFAVGRVERIKPAVLIAEQQHGASAVARHDNRRPHRSARLVGPVNAARVAVEGVDHAARAAHEEMIVENCRRRERRYVSGKCERPLEFQPLHLIDGQARGLGRLITHVAGAGAPAVPFDLGIGRHFHRADLAKSRRGQRRFDAGRAQIIRHGLALRDGHGIGDGDHFSVVERAQDVRRRQLLQRFARRDARVVLVVASRAALLEDSFARRRLGVQKGGGRGQGKRRQGQQSITSHDGQYTPRAFNVAPFRIDAGSPAQ